MEEYFKANFIIIWWDISVNGFMNWADMSDSWSKAYWEIKSLTIEYIKKPSLKQVEKIVPKIIEGFDKQGYNIYFIYLDTLEDSANIKKVKKILYRNKNIKSISDWKKCFLLDSYIKHLTK
jgi:hypothetical protein